MNKEYETVYKPIKEKTESRKAEVEKMTAGAAAAEKDVTVAQAECDKALREGVESKYAEAAERLARAKNSQSFYAGRVKLLDAEPVITDAEFTAYQTKVLQILQNDEAKALQQIAGIVKQLGEIKATLDASVEATGTGLKGARAAAKKESPYIEILGNPNIRHFCKNAQAEYERSFQKN